MLEARSSDSSLSSKVLDDIRGVIKTERVLGDEVSPEGISQSLLYGQNGTDVDGGGIFTPGIDDPTNFDANASLASGEGRARKVLGVGVPRAINVVIDQPKRTDFLEGKSSYRYLGAQAIAVAAVTAELIGDTNISIYHTKAPRTGLLFAGEPTDAEGAFRNLKRLEGNDEEKTLEELLSSLGHNIDDENDATMVVSDFMDGFDPESGEFSWEAGLKRIGHRQEDLLRILKINSASHERLPFGVIDGLDSETIDSMNGEYAATFRQKQLRIKRVFNSMLAKTMSIDMDEERTTHKTISLLNGEPQ